MMPDDYQVVFVKGTLTERSFQDWLADNGLDLRRIPDTPGVDDLPTYMIVTKDER